MSDKPTGSTRAGLTIAAAATGDTAVTVVLSGRLDAVAAPELRTELDRWVGSGHADMTVDLSAVTFVDSAGLAILVRARRETMAIGGDVVLVSPAEDAALRVFRLTQFDQVFQMLPARGA